MNQMKGRPRQHGYGTEFIRRLDQERPSLSFRGYSKKAFEDSAAAWEKLVGAKSLEKALEVQSEYLKSSYEDFIAQSTKLGELYVDLAREAYKPFEGMLAKTAAMK